MKKIWWKIIVNGKKNKTCIIWKVLCQKSTVKVRQSSNISAGKGAHAENKEEQLKNRKKEVQCMAHPLVPFWIRLILKNSNFVVSIITIIDSGDRAVYTPSCWTSGSVPSLSIPVPFLEANSGRASIFKVFNAKLSWKSRWLL